MFNLSLEELKKLGANITANEIKQQPDLWKETLNNFINRQDEIKDFIGEIKSKYDYIEVIFTGAGTSAYVGETLLPQLNTSNSSGKVKFLSYPTTDIVSNPKSFFKESVPTILVSFARSGNSPESVAAVKLAKKIIKNLYQITITCAKDGKLALSAKNDEKNLLILQPERANDQGFAMTGSYSCMYLTSLLIFDDNSLNNKKIWIDELIVAGKSVINKYDVIQKIADIDVDRIIYLGSGSYYGLAHETQLKVLELTAGIKATMYETILGFRHGPKSFVNEQTAIIIYESTNEYTQKYDYDLINEISQDNIAKLVVKVGSNNEKIDKVENFVINISDHVPDGYRVLPYLLFGQIYALICSVNVGNTPDTPSENGTVNRVVKGVTIHDF